MIASDFRQLLLTTDESELSAHIQLLLKRSERKAIGDCFLALFLLVIAFFAASSSRNGAGQFSPFVEQVRYTVGLVLLCESGVSILAAIWFVGQYVYFFRWPEQFDYQNQESYGSK